ncbi:response regulator [Rasiella sp. SM2506]|uniref:tetratricopeptide repeat-containing hybrid sensor histidine kinase/response regulator n=1 Tax=Rasiella sp. SM2506 TaxID=3423914 RepID=UPI003D78D933
MRIGFMRISSVFIFIFLQVSSIYAQERPIKRPISSNATLSEIKVHIDSIKKSITGYYYKEDYSSAILKATEILRIAEENKLSLEVAEIRSYLANSYLHLNDSVKSLEYARKNIRLAEKLNNTNVLVSSQIDIGNIYLAFGELDKAIESFKMVIPLAEEINDTRRLFILNYNITEIYLEYLKDPKGAKPYLDAADTYVSTDFKIGLAGLTLFKAHYAFQDKAYDTALMYYKQTIDIAKEANYIEVLKKGYTGYINCLAKKGDYKMVYEIGKIEDSLQQARSAEEIRKSAKILTANLKNAKIQEELENRELRNELVLERAATERKFLYISIVVSLLLLSLLVYLLLVIKNRRKLTVKLKKKNQEYLEAKLESEKLAKAKSRFLSTMSHELRTPLYGIIGLSTILNNDTNLKSHKTELQSLKFSADYLLNLVNDVLTLNKMDSGVENKVEAKRFLLKDFLHNLKESLEYITGQTNNDLLISLDPMIPDWIRGDQTKLSQVLINLLGNALKFTENGLVRLVVSLVQKTEDDVILKFEVIDTGKGIPESDQKKIFEEFGQLDDQKYFHGSGLGLTIVQKLLVDMGSNIQLKSVVNEGSNFFFELTFGMSTKDTSDKEIPDEASLKLLRGKKLLVVDDNTINLLVTKKTLETHKIIVDVAMNGPESIDKIKQTTYDLVLMDVNMPGMDGIEATKRIRALNKSVVIIALTAVTQNEQEDRFKNVQFDDTIVKPYKINEFLKILATNLIQKKEDV